MSKPSGERKLGRPPGSDGEETRRLILNAAFELFLELGYEKTSFQAIASRAGITRPALYNYFACKRDLATAILHRNNIMALAPSEPQWWQEELDPRLKAGQKLAALIQRSLASAAVSRRVRGFYLEIIRSSDGDPLLRRALRAYVHDQRETLRTIVTDGARSGEIPADVDIDGVLDGLQGMIWSLSIGYLSAPNDRIRQQVMTSARLLFVGDNWWNADPDR